MRYYLATFGNNLGLKAFSWFLNCYMGSWAFPLSRAAYLVNKHNRASVGAGAKGADTDSVSKCIDADEWEAAH